MSDEARLTIDGREAHGVAGEPLVETLERAGVEVSAVCYHPSLGALETCDGCWVEVAGDGGAGSTLVRACSTALAPGMAVAPGSERAREARLEGIQRLMRDHELYCTLCDNNNGSCEVKAAVQAAGVTHARYAHRAKGTVDATNPFYRYDPNQCIACGRCVEACQNLQVNETLTMDWEAERPQVLWDGGVEIGESSCVSCGHCVTVCPCNALMETSMLGETGPWTGLEEDLSRSLIDLVKGVERATGFGPIMALSEADAHIRARDVERTKTVCTYCGVGCSFEMWTRGREILKVEPRPEAPANGVSTCVKGKFGWGHVSSPDRLTRPLIRVRSGEGGGEEGGHGEDTFREATWDEALDLVARRFREIASRHRRGADALGFIASSKCTNEEAYLVQKLARAVIGTNNVDNCSRYCQAPATTGLWRTVGYGGDSGSITDLAAADLVLIVGSNTAESHPVLATRVKRAQKLHGQTLVVADLREHEMARRADVFLRPKPGTDLVWLSALTRRILELGLEDREFLEARVHGTGEHGLERYRESLEPFTLERAEEITGIPVETLDRVARAIGEAGSVCACWAMGVTQHCGGSDTSTAISNLLLVTGNYGRPGTGAYPLRGHNNVQGTSDFGAMPTFLPGYEPVDDDAVRRRWSDGWGVEVPTGQGLDNHEMVDAIHVGDLAAMMIVGEDMAIVDANSLHVRAAFERLDFLVVQELFLTETARMADVVLPAAPSVEKEGTFTNTERRLQRLYRVFEPLGGARPDWEILVDLAHRLGAGWSYGHPGEILEEAASLSEMFAGVTWEALAGWGSLQWPVAADGSDQPLLYRERFHFPDGLARFHPLEWIPPCEEADDDVAGDAGDGFDLHLNNGRLLEHFHEGTMTYRTEGIAAMAPEVFVELSPELAAERGVEEGDTVRLTSRRGSLEVRAVVTDRVRGRELYMPMSSWERPVNVLTGSHTDRATHTPAYKELAVRLEPVDGAAGVDEQRADEQAADGRTNGAGNGRRRRRPKSPLPPHNHRRGTPTPRPGVEVERKWARSDYTPPPRAVEGD